MELEQHQYICPVVVHMQSQAHPLIAKIFSASFFTVTANLQETANRSCVFSESLSITLWRNNGLHILHNTPSPPELMLQNFRIQAKFH